MSAILDELYKKKCLSYKMNALGILVKDIHSYIVIRWIKDVNVKDCLSLSYSDKRIKKVNVDMMIVIYCWLICRIDR